MPFVVERLDHIVLNCNDPDATIAWYQRVLGMVVEQFGPERRRALRWGNQKFNVRPTGAPDWNTGQTDAPGSLDLCFITSDPLEAVVEHLRHCGVAITKGPVEQFGATGMLRSVYFRDPDGNLIEVAVYPTEVHRAASDR